MIRPIPTKGLADNVETARSYSNAQARTCSQSAAVSRPIADGLRHEQDCSPVRCQRSNGSHRGRVGQHQFGGPPMSDIWQDVRAEFNERAAILEYDNGLTRTEAEAQAVRELVDRLHEQSQPSTGIVAELADANRHRSHPDLAEVLAALGLTDVRSPAWGFDAVVPEGNTYRPAEATEQGHQAAIVPAVEEGAVVDLVAQGLNSGRMLSRLGATTVIGADEIERARQSGEPLIVFTDGLSWLRGHARGVVVLNWQEAGRVLEGVETLLCRTELAERLHKATRHCWPVPTIAVAEGFRHAA